jgi:hypothetical protein
MGVAGDDARRDDAAEDLADEAGSWREGGKRTEWEEGEGRGGGAFRG